MLTALIRNLYKFLTDRIDAKAFGLKKTSRIKAFFRELGKQFCYIFDGVTLTKDK